MPKNEPTIERAIVVVGQLRDGEPAIYATKIQVTRADFIDGQLDFRAKNDAVEFGGFSAAHPMTYFSQEDFSVLRKFNAEFQILDTTEEGFGPASKEARLYSVNYTNDFLAASPREATKMALRAVIEDGANAVFTVNRSGNYDEQPIYMDLGVGHEEDEDEDEDDSATSQLS